MSSLENKNIELDIDFIASSIQTILQKTHSNKQKWTIKKKHDRLSFACPICGDSHKDVSQKRGHLFLNNLYYKCYNEDCRSTFTKLCKDYSVQLDPTKKLAVINWVDNNSQQSWSKKDDDTILMNTYDKLLTIDQIQNWFNSGQAPLKGFMPVNVGSQTYKYLKNRGIRDDQMNLFYEGIKYNGKWHEPYVVFINRINNKILGIQERNLESGLKRRFKIWTFTELYESVTGEDLDQIEAIAYNKVSCVYNVFNVDYEKEVTIFEGYLDSIWFPNSIAVVGINTDINFLLKSDVNVKFFFDNDGAGKRKAKQMLKQGYNVFLWDKLKKWWHEKEGGDRWMNYRWFEDNIKDMNDVHKELHISYKELQQFFSSSSFDVMWITGEDKEKKIYKKEIRINNINWDKHINDLLKNDTK